MSVNIHTTAIIEDGAQICDNVTVGAYSYIGGMTTIGEGSVIHHHATVSGKTTIGKGNIIHPYAYIGAPTHDLKYTGGDPELKIGDYNVFREYCTAHVATKDGNCTVIGNNNVFLAYSHIAHDCVIGNGIVVSSLSAFGGHVRVDDFANIGWNVGVHQFCAIGKYAMVGAKSKVVRDVPPYMLSDGIPSIVRCPNFVNLKRHNFSQERITQIKTIYKIFYMRGTNRSCAIDAIKSENIDDDILSEYTNFLSKSAR